MGLTLQLVCLLFQIAVVQWVALSAIVVVAAADGSSAHTPPPYGGGTTSSSSGSTSQPQPPQTLPRSTNRRYSSDPNKNNNSNNKSSYSLYNHNNYDDNDDPNHPHSSKSNQLLLPPWNPSPYIDPQTGFLQGVFVRTPGIWEQEEPLRTRHTLDAPCRIRQVPGDGNCLFHSISLCLCEAVNGTQWNLSPSTSTDTLSASSSSGSSTSGGTAVSHGGGGSGNTVRTSSKTTTRTTTKHLPPPSPPVPSLAELYAQSHKLRADAVACLRDKRRRFILQGRDRLRADDLVQAAAQQYGMTPEDYCQAMQQDCVWGGGPEIVALCNLLQRPIHVYELATAEAVHLEQQQQQQSNHKNNYNEDKSMDNHPPTAASTWDENRRRSWLQQRGATGCGTTGFVLRRMACFGSPRFDRQKALHILSADSRFPDLQPGQQLPAGNHFLAVFPDEGLLQQQRDSDDSSNDKDEPGRSLWRKSRKRLRGGDWIDYNPKSTAGRSEKSNSGSDKTIGQLGGVGVPSDSFLSRAESKCRHWWNSVWYLS